MLISVLAVALSLQGIQIDDAAAPTIEEYLALRRIEEVQPAPSGQTVALTVSETDLTADAHRTRLYLWRPASGAQLVTGVPAEIGSPRWSRDGNWLAFLAVGRDSAVADGAGAQIWLLSASAGRAPRRLSQLAGRVVEFDWSSNGTIYALTRNVRSGAGEIWRLTVADSAAERVWAGDPSARDLALSPDGSTAALSVKQTGAPEGDPAFDIWLIDLASGRARQLTRRPGPETAPAWSPDGHALAFRAPQNPRHPGSQLELFRINQNGEALTNLTDSFDRTIVEQRWAPSGDLLFTAALGIYTHLFAVRTNGAIEPLASGAFTISSFSARPVGTAVYAARESAIEATELWRLDSSGATRLTRLNRRAEGWRLGRQEVVRWQAPDGLAIEGLLTYPVGYREGRRYPLIVNAAGRGAGRVRAALDPRDPHRLFATQGYAVLAPQMRGGQGYGEGFATARPMDLAGGELTDLLAGVDHLIERGIADPERLALLGRGSSDEGVDLVSRVIARTPRFQAAVLSYGDLAPVGTLRPTDTRAARLDRLERDDLPPIELMRSVRTPLLIIDAEPGTRVSRPKQVHSALSDLERPVQYVEVNPEDRAGLRPRDAVDLFFRQLRWLDRYLKFGGADLFDFYLTGEWVPGPEGWQLQLARAEPRADYSGMKPEGGRYLEVELAFRPDDDLVREDSGSGLSLDPAQAIQLTDPEARARPLAGTVTELFGNETLIMGAPGVLSIPPSGDTLPTTVSLKLAFEISDQAAEYRLFVRGYRPVRVYVSGRR